MDTIVAGAPDLSRASLARIAYAPDEATMDTDAPILQVSESLDAAVASPAELDVVALELAGQLQSVLAFSESCRRRAPGLDLESADLINAAVSLYRKTMNLS